MSIQLSLPHTINRLKIDEIEKKLQQDTVAQK